MEGFTIHCFWCQLMVPFTLYETGTALFTRISHLKQFGKSQKPSSLRLCLTARTWTTICNTTTTILMAGIGRAFRNKFRRYDTFPRHQLRVLLGVSTAPSPTIWRRSETTTHATTKARTIANVEKPTAISLPPPEHLWQRLLGPGA